MENEECPVCGITEWTRYQDEDGRYIMSCDRCDTDYLDIVAYHNAPQPITISDVQMACIEALSIRSSHTYDEVSKAVFGALRPAKELSYDEAIILIKYWNDLKHKEKQTNE